MHFNQTASAAFITAIRVLLQIATMYLFKNIVSRAYNITYVERLQADAYSKLNYIFMTRFPVKKHFFGRFMALIALVVSTALTVLPTLLNKLYPVNTMYVSANNQLVNITYNQLNLAKVEPNGTDALALMNSLGFPTANKKFLDFAAPPLSMSHCQLTPGPNSDYHYFTCLGSNNLLEIRAFRIETIPSIGNGGNVTPVNGTDFYRFHLVGVVDVKGLYHSLASVLFNGSTLESSVSGIPSIDSCFGTGTVQCVRHTLGYFIVRGEGVVITERKLSYLSYDPGVYSTSPHVGAACKILSTRTLQDMCSLIDWNQPGNIDSYQSATNTDNGIQYNFLWWDNVLIGSISFNISFVGYAGTPIKIQDFDFLNTNYTYYPLNETMLNYHLGQELFEATKINTAITYQNNTDWFNWGFSQQDIDNMANFLNQGTNIFGGGTIVTEGELLVEIPNLVVCIIAAAIVLLFCIGYFVGLRVDPTVGLPISEIFAVATKSGGTAKSSKFWKKDAANLTLRRSLAPSQKGSREEELPPRIYVNDICLLVQDDEVRLLDL